jgi:hypothetical protein
LPYWWQSCSTRRRAIGEELLLIVLLDVLLTEEKKLAKTLQIEANVAASTMSLLMPTGYLWQLFSQRQIATT